MSTEQKKSLDYLYNKFPRMRPLNGAPSLFTVNGIGVKVYGRRDYDAKTDTFVKTRCLCVFFIPVFALDAFRVADADGGAHATAAALLQKTTRFTPAACAAFKTCRVPSTLA